MEFEELRIFLDEKVRQYNQADFFLEDDPIQIPHRFQQRADIEISAFFAAILAWGQRPTIIRNARRLMTFMDHAPAEYILQHQPSDRQAMAGFVHRTFNFEDLQFFLARLQRIYREYGSMEDLFLVEDGEDNMKFAIHRFREAFLGDESPVRSRKHLSDPLRNSACKRLNMFLRWMVRGKDEKVDFGLWDRLSPSLLSCPLDVHSGRVARKLGLLQRPANDWKAVEELDKNLRKLNPEDPSRYDFALYGLGVFEKF